MFAGVVAVNLVYVVALILQLWPVSVMFGVSRADCACVWEVGCQSGDLFARQCCCCMWTAVVSGCIVLNMVGGLLVVVTVAHVFKQSEIVFGKRKSTEV